MNCKALLIVAIIFIGFSSCKKDKDDPTPKPETPLDHPYLKTGNYWVYETVYVDDTGKETHQGFDSTFVEKDTMINGAKWYKNISRGTDFTGPHNYIYFWRDSAGILVNNYGVMPAAKFKKTGIIDSTLYIVNTDTIYKSISELKPNDSTVTVPAGTFKVKTVVTTYQLFVDQKGKYVYKDSPNWYSEDLGVSIFSTTFYVSPALQSSSEHFEKRLVRYKVK